MRGQTIQGEPARGEEGCNGWTDDVEDDFYDLRVYDPDLFPNVG